MLITAGISVCTWMQHSCRRCAWDRVQLLSQVGILQGSVKRRRLFPRTSPRFQLAVGRSKVHAWCTPLDAMARAPAATPGSG